MSTILIIGSGFSALSATCYLARGGVKVTVLEKNESIGGRARIFEAEGFRFDMGPSWYWMPDIFENFFKDFGSSTAVHYDLKKLDPGFQLFFEEGEAIEIPASMQALNELFEQLETGSSKQLQQFIREGEFKYRTGMQDLAYKPALSWFEYVNFKVLKGIFKTHLFQPMRAYVRKYFKDKRLVALMEFPVLFLGAKPENIPALYSLMNYSALVQGTYYPMGGMYKIVEGMKQVALNLGVTFRTGEEIKNIVTKDGKVTGVMNVNGVFTAADVVISSADYHHTEQTLLGHEDRNYEESYWDNKTFAPSCLIFYLGVSKKINTLLHHNLFFDKDFDKHAEAIYDTPHWPEEPLFYVCCPSKTDESVAPEGMENIFVLMPIATGLKDTDLKRDFYFTKIIERLEKACGEPIQEHIIYKKSYCVKDFVKDYNAYKGNAYGLANTLKQTAVFKPSVRNKHLKNLFYTGQLTVPGPGVPPALISGKISAEQALNYLKKEVYETVI